MTAHRAILARLRAQLTRPDQARPAALAPAHRVTAEQVGTAVVHIYDEIGGWGIWASDIVPELRALNVGEIEVRLNSPGGDFFDGVAIGNALAEHPAHVTVHVDGLAASAASIIAMAGDDIVMHPGSQMMIHDARCFTYGDVAEHARSQALLDSASADIAELYAARTGVDTADDWRTRMQVETWYRADEAVTAGLATGTTVRPPAPELVEPVAASTPRWVALLNAWREHAQAPIEDAALARWEKELLDQGAIPAAAASSDEPTNVELQAAVEAAAGCDTDELDTCACQRTQTADAASPAPDAPPATALPTAAAPAPPAPELPPVFNPELLRSAMREAVTR